MMPSIDSFSRFSELPKELRLKIWEYTICTARIIELSWSSRARSVISKTTPPAPLHTCRESRDELIRKYDELRFGNSSQAILINYSLDVLYFGPGCRHLTPSGRSSPWVELNRKLMRDIIGSKSLQQNLGAAAFDCGFLSAMEHAPDYPSTLRTHDLFGSMTNLTDVSVVRPKNWEERGEQRRQELRFVRAGIVHVYLADPCHKLRTAYFRLRGLEANFLFEDVEILEVELCEMSPPPSPGQLQRQLFREQSTVRNALRTRFRIRRLKVPNNH